MTWLKFSMCLILLLLSPPVTEARASRPLRHIKMSKEAFEAEFEISRQVLESMLALSALFDEGEMEMVQGVLICSKIDCFFTEKKFSMISTVIFSLDSFNVSQGCNKPIQLVSTGELCITALLHQEMASLRCMLSLVFILLILSLHVSSSNATRYGGLVNMQKRVNRRQVLQDLLGSDLPKTIRNNNKVGGGKGLAPEGPDPEHH
nr:CLAVATA3/ESR (CLE)-related protein 6-like [Ipomoea batatas]